MDHPNGTAIREDPLDESLPNLPYEATDACPHVCTELFHTLSGEDAEYTRGTSPFL